MAAISVQDVDLVGIDPTFTAAEETGDTIQNANERVVIRIKNGAGAARTVTINAQNPCSHGFEHDVAVVTADGDDITVGPFDKERFNTASGLLSLTYDDHTSVTIAALNITKAP